MFIKGFGVDKNIINVNKGEMTKGIEDIIHNVLEFTKSILKAKRHNIPLIMSKRGGKSSFGPIILTNLDLPEPRFHVKLGEHHNFT